MLAPRRSKPVSKHDVFVDGRSVIHKGSGDKAIASAPDVCKTPVGSAVVPIPYPNISNSSSLKGGSKTTAVPLTFISNSSDRH
ncbi:MAG: DUF4150 domain-containing protein [Gammaproteobacteria bacterium]|nr:DUF4150 domain-containing protein [Gammaproteobacteria bacterium]